MVIRLSGSIPIFRWPWAHLLNACIGGLGGALRGGLAWGVEFAWGGLGVAYSRVGGCLNGGVEDEAIGCVLRSSCLVGWTGATWGPVE